MLTGKSIGRRVSLRFSMAKVSVTEFLIGAQGRWFWSQSFSEPVSDILLFVNMGTPKIKKK